MDTDELESKLEGQTETQSLDFKGPCIWEASKLAKDILALSNVQDGGSIIIGVEDKTFARLGVSSTEMETFRLDIMRDQMASYADPHVNFTVHFPKDRNGIQYVVIRVYEFVEVPVICRKDSTDTRAGVIYYRNRNRRPESAAVSNSYDMRDIIERATVRRMQNLRHLGLDVAAPDRRKFEDELGGL